MNLGVILRILWERYYTTFGTAVVVIWLGAALLAGAEDRHVATGRVAIFGPDERVAEERQGADNPFLVTEEAYVQASRAISGIVTNRASRMMVREEGYLSAYEVSPVPDQPVLVVRTEASSDERALETTRRVLDLVVATVQQTQQAAGSGVEHELRAGVVDRPEVATRVSPDTGRVVTALLAVWLMLALGLALALESLKPSVRLSDAHGSATRGPDSRDRAVEPAGLLVGFVAVTVLVPQRYQFGGFAVTGAVAVGLIAGWVWIYGRTLHGSTFGRRFSGVMAALGALVGVVVLSYAVNQARVLQDFEAQAADRKPVALMALVSVALLAIDGIRRLSTVRALTGVIVAFLACNAAIGVLQFAFGFDLFGFTRIFARGGVPRSAGLANHPIDFGVASAAAVPLALHLAIHASTPRRRRFAGVAALVLALGAMASVSRSSLLCLVLGVVILVIGRRGRDRVRPLIGAAVFVLVLLIAIPDALTGYDRLASGEAGQPAINARVSAYDTVLETWRERPLLGGGFGTWEPTEAGGLDNSFLKLTVELGIAGAAAFALLVGAAIGSGRSVRRASSDAATRDLALALMAALAAVAASGFFYDLIGFQQGGGLFFLLLGLLGALRLIVPGRPPSTVAPGLDDVEVSAVGRA